MVLTPRMMAYSGTALNEIKGARSANTIVVGNLKN